MRIIPVILLALAFLAVSAVAIYLTYQIFAVYFTSHMVGMVAAGILLVVGGFMATRSLLKAA